MLDNTISSLNIKEKSLKLSWDSSCLLLGKQRFHYTWLRDYCLCVSCRHIGSSQRLLDISNSERTKLAKPLSITKEADQIIIRWDENPTHQSIFPISWLLSRRNNLDLSSSQEQRYLWDRTWIDTYPPQRHPIDNTSTEVWKDELMQRGFTILSDLTPDKLEAFLASLGKIYPTEYGTTCTIKKFPNPKDLAMDSSYALPLHTDLRYMSAHRLILCQYCIENTVQGGESILVDGFKVAADFRQKFPHYFQLLAEIPVQYRYFDPKMEYFFSHETTILKLDKSNNISDIYFGHQNCDRDVPYEKITAFYEAYCEFYRQLKSSQYQYIFRIEPGQIVLIQNFRILHGRMPFDENSGFRHLEIGYADWDHFLGRQNFHKVKHLYLDI